jgi:hypothetical protein
MFTNRKKAILLILIVKKYGIANSHLVKFKTNGITIYVSYELQVELQPRFFSCMQDRLELEMFSSKSSFN